MKMIMRIAMKQSRNMWTLISQGSRRYNGRSSCWSRDVRYCRMYNDKYMSTLSCAVGLYCFGSITGNL